MTIRTVTMSGKLNDLVEEGMRLTGQTDAQTFLAHSLATYIALVKLATERGADVRVVYPDGSPAESFKLFKSVQNS